MDAADVPADISTGDDEESVAELKRSIAFATSNLFGYELPTVFVGLIFAITCEVTLKYLTRNESEGARVATFWGFTAFLLLVSWIRRCVCSRSLISKMRAIEALEKEQRYATVHQGQRRR